MDAPPDSARLRDCAFVIPVYNHARGLRRVLEQAVSLGIPVIVVDDGSTDGSGDVARRFDDVTVLHHSVNRGKGAALTTGLAEASKVAMWAITVDADGQHDPRQAPALMEAVAVGKRPIVVGRRVGMEGEEVPWTSRFGRKFSNFWVTAAGGPAVTDSQSGFRLYPLPEVLALRCRASRFQFEVEVLVLARWAGIEVMEVPVGVNYAPEGGRISHFRPFVDFWRNSATFSRLITTRCFVPSRTRNRLARKP